MADPTINGYNRVPPAYGNALPKNNNVYSSQYGARGQVGQQYGMQNPADLATLAHSFQGMNLHNQSFATQAKNAVMSNAAGTYPSYPVAGSMPNSFYGPGPYAYPTNYAATSHAPNHNLYTPNPPQYMPQYPYQGYQQHDNSPLSQNWTPTTATTENVPTLITPRRGSISSNENDQPATPSYASYQGSAHGGVAVHRSPNGVGVYNHSTPSPTSLVAPYAMAMAKQRDHSEVSPHIRSLIAREPAIPHAIPAPSSPLKPLDRALENQRGETNVYIRGLLPETTDEMLEAWGARFGDIKSSKSIIDHITGQCKG